MSTFPQFTSFPLEIQALILESCPPNDKICLSLTCKNLYNLSPSKSPMPLDNTDTGPLCSQADAPNWQAKWAHRRDCHKLSYAALCLRAEKQGKQIPDDFKKCRTRWQAFHCECFTRRSRLFLRLKPWMPKGLSYCWQCSKFTKRKRQHNGRCYHGKAKVRKYEGNYWTHTSRGGAFGRKIWKRWFNNRAMNNLEIRLSTERPEQQRKGSERYAMRTLEAKEEDTKEVRDSHASTYPHYGVRRRHGFP